MLKITEKTIKRLSNIGALKESLLSERVNSDRFRCNMCQWRCVIPPDGVGHCHTIVNYNMKLYTTIYGVISSAAVDPIEKKPVFHYKPGSSVFSVGSLGCNFRCVFCQNWEIAYADALNDSSMCRTGITPEKLLQMAQSNAAEGVAWTYNEPSIWLNYTLDCAKLCKKNGLYTIYVTNGYSTPEALDMIAPYLDVYRVDIKSMEPEFYKKLIKVPFGSGIFDVAKRAKQKWGIHVECVTNIIPTWNDSTENLTKTANWICESLGSDTPWHITRFFPYGELSNLSPTPINTLMNAVKIAKNAGLKFVYLGNVSTETGENTYCPECGNLCVERLGYQTRITGLNKEGKCAQDNTDLNMHI